MNSRRIIGNPLKKLPKEHKFAVEIRNKDWLVPKLARSIAIRTNQTPADCKNVHPDARKGHGKAFKSLRD